MEYQARYPNYIITDEQITKNEKAPVSDIVNLVFDFVDWINDNPKRAIVLSIVLGSVAVGIGAVGIYLSRQN